jgi:hypothetical protein
VLTPLISVDRELVGFNLSVPQGLILRTWRTNAASMVQPATQQLYRSIQTARYRQPALVRM